MGGAFAGLPFRYAGCRGAALAFRTQPGATACTGRARRAVDVAGCRGRRLRPGIDHHLEIAPAGQGEEEEGGHRAADVQGGTVPCRWMSERARGVPCPLG
jgi:hypothetical protein